MKKRNLVPCLAIALSLGVILAGCSQQNTEGSPEPESLVQQDGSSQMTEEEPLPDGIEEGVKSGARSGGRSAGILLFS